MRTRSSYLAVLLLAAAPLGAELLETEIVFQGSGCVPCAESLEPRLARIRGVETVEVDLDKSLIKLKLAAHNKTRLGPLRLRVTQDGTKIVGMRAVVQGVAMEKDGAWIFTVGGLNETLDLKPAKGLDLEGGRAYRVNGRILEAEGGGLSLEADAAEPIPQP